MVPRMETPVAWRGTDRLRPAWVCSESPQRDPWAARYEAGIGPAHRCITDHEPAKGLKAQQEMGSVEPAHRRGTRLGYLMGYEAIVAVPTSL